MNDGRITAITRNRKLQSILHKVAAGDTDFTDFKINDIISAYRQVIAYFFKLRRRRNGAEEKTIVGPWITALLRARARKWADRGIEYLDEQIRKAEERKRDPEYMPLFDDIYYDALYAERDRITSAQPTEA